MTEGINSDNPCEFYFNQYWACTNPQIFSIPELVKVLRDVWIECWKFFDCDQKNKPENWLKVLGDFYTKRITKGEKVYNEYKR